MGTNPYTYQSKYTNSPGPGPKCVLDPIISCCFWFFIYKYRAPPQGPRPADLASFTSPRSVPSDAPPPEIPNPKPPTNCYRCHLFFCESPLESADPGAHVLLFLPFVLQLVFGANAPWNLPIWVPNFGYFFRFFVPSVFLSKSHLESADLGAYFLLLLPFVFATCF